MMHYGKYIQQTLFLVSAGITTYACIFMPSLYVYGWLVYGIWLVGIIAAAFYHRCLSHGAWKCPRWLQIFLTIVAAGHAFTPAISWVSIHRKHHRFSDTAEDPHGPQVGFIKNALISFYNTDLKYAGRLWKDRLYTLQLEYYFTIVIVYFVLWSWLFGPLSWFIINGVVYLLQATINYIAHDGYKPINLSHAHALLFSAETYHATHHKYPNEARTGLVDIPYLTFIRVFDPETAKRIPRWLDEDERGD